MTAQQGWGPAEWLLTSMTTLVLAALVVAVMLWALRLAGSRPRAIARAQLDERFARGELGVDEYRRRRDLIARS